MMDSNLSVQQLNSNLIDENEESLDYDMNQEDEHFFRGAQQEFEILVQTYLRDQSHTSKKQAILNIVYATTNAGLVALPYAAFQAGLPLYLILIVIVASISGYTNYMIIRMANEHRVRSLEDLCERAFGAVGYVVVCFIQIVFSLSLMCMTLDVCADIVTDIVDATVPQNLNSSSWVFPNSREHRRIISVVFGSLLVLPACVLTRSMSSLWWSSYVAVIFVVSALLSVMIAYIMNFTPYLSQGTVAEMVEPKGMFWTAPYIVTFCFSYSQKAFPIYSCLRRRSSPRWRVSVTNAHILTASLYLLFGIFGYMCTIQKQIDGIEFNFFLNQVNQKYVTWFDVARAIAAVSILLTFPADCLVATSTFRRMWRRWGRHLRSMESVLEQPNHFGDTESDSLVNPNNLLTTTNRTNPHDFNPEATMATRDTYLKDEESVTDENSKPKKIQDPLRPTDPSRSKSQASSLSTCSTTSFKSARSFSLGSVAPNEQVYMGGGVCMSGERDDREVFKYEEGDLDDRGDGFVKNSDMMMEGLPGDGERRRSNGSENKVGEGISASNIDNMNINYSRNIRSESRDRFYTIESDGSKSSKQASDKEAVKDLVDAADRTKSMNRNVANTGTNNENGHGKGFGWRLFGALNPASSDGNTFLDDTEGGDGWWDDSLRFQPQTHSSAIDATVPASTLYPSPSKDQMDNKNSCVAFFVDAFPGLMMWVIALIVCTLVVRWEFIAVSIGSFASAFLVFIVPSALYFRLGLAADFTVIPFMGFIPNRVYMFLTQSIGIVLFLAGLSLVFYTEIDNVVVVQ